MFGKLENLFGRKKVMPAETGISALSDEGSHGDLIAMRPETDARLDDVSMMADRLKTAAGVKSVDALSADIDRAAALLKLEKDRDHSTDPTLH